jgi:hypothetical protein
MGGLCIFFFCKIKEKIIKIAKAKEAILSANNCQNILLFVVRR